MIKKLVMLTCLIFLFYSVAFASGANEVEATESGFVVGFANGYVGNTWRMQFVEEVEAVLLKYKEQGVVADYQIANCNNDVTSQMNQINSMINSGFDAIVIDPVSATALTSVIENATSKGIIVVIANDAAAYENTYCIGQDIKNLLTIATKWTAIQMGGKGNMVYISGLPGNSSDTLRTDATKEVLAEYPNIKMLATAPGKWSQAEAHAVMSMFLQTYGDDIDAELSQDIMSEGVLQAYENAGIAPKIITGDCTKSFLKVWKGYPDLKAICVPAVTNTGSWGVDLAVGLLQGKDVNEDVLIGNPLNESMVNYIQMPVPYIIVEEEELGNKEFMTFMEERFPYTKIMTYDEAVEDTADMSDTYTLGFSLTDDDLSRIFK